MNASLLSHIISYHHWHHNPCKYIHVLSCHHQCHNLFSALLNIMLLLVLDERNHNLWNWQIVQFSMKSSLKLADSAVLEVISETTVLDKVISENGKEYSPWWSHLWKWHIVVLDEVISENGRLYSPWWSHPWNQQTVQYSPRWCKVLLAPAASLSFPGRSYEVHVLVVLHFTDELQNPAQ